MQLHVFMANRFNIIFTSSLGPVQFFRVSNENKVSCERKKKKRIWLQSHQQLLFLVKILFWEVKDCTELLVLNSSQDL